MLKEYINPRYEDIVNTIENDLSPRFDINLPEIQDHNEYGYRAFYLNNPKVRRANYPIEYTQNMIEEMARCKADILYFAERYFYIRVPGTGRIKIPLRNYQKEFLRAMEYDELTEFEFLAARQSAKSTTMTVRMLHGVVFNADYQIAMVAQRPSTAGEIFSRVRMAYSELPLWLQPGVEEWQKGSCTLGNSSKIFAAGSTPDALRGWSLDELLVDEACFIKNDEDFFKAITPTLEANPHSKLITASTPNGKRGYFYNNWIKALKGSNSFFSMGVPWWLVPGRDEAWKQKTIENSTVLAFKQEHDLVFTSTESALIDNETMEHIELTQAVNPIHIVNEEVEIFENPKEDAEYLMIVDTAEGKGLDNSTFTVFKVSDRPYIQVCSFESNSVSPLIYATHVKKWAEHYNSCLIIVENNNVSGALVAYQLHMILEYEYVYCQHGRDETGIGVRTSVKVKSLGCSTLKGLLSSGVLELRSKATVLELMNFEAKGSSFAGADGFHDDLVQNLWMFAWFTNQSEFDDYLAGESIINDIHGEDIEDINAMELPTDEDHGSNQDIW